MSIAFIDLQAQRRRLGGKIEAAMMAAVESGAYVMGPPVREFEQALAAFGGAKHALGCGNGTDALVLPLKAWGVGAGDAVFVPSFTFCATAEIVPWTGATPVFIDIDPVTYNMDPGHLEAAIEATLAEGKLTPKVVIAVDLFGQPADYEPLQAFCDRQDLALICDAAQSLGATYRDRRVGSIGLMTTTSFFPSKPLGCYGDGGAIFTDDDALAAKLRSLHVHGRGADKYDNVLIGMNSRLDTLQAAILLEKLRIFPDEIVRREAVALRYKHGLEGVVRAPTVRSGCTSVWAQFTVRVDAERRADFIARLREAGVPTAIYYPTPLHRQTAYRRYPVSGNGLPSTDVAAREVVALPMHPYLTEDAQDHIVRTIKSLTELTS